MSNEVEIHVSWKDDDGKALSGLKDKAKKAGGDAGDEWSGSFSGRLGKAVPAKIKVDVDDRLAKAKVAELGAKKNAVVVAFDADVVKAEARIADLEAKRGKTKIDVDAEIAKAKAKIDALTATKNRVLIELDANPEPAVRKVRKATEDVEKATDKVAARTQAKFNALAFTSLSLGLPAAATIGAAGASAALASVPALFIGLGAFAAKGNAQVADSYTSLWTRVKTETQAAAGVLVPSLVQASTQIGASWDRLRPQISGAMSESSARVEDLVGTVTDLAENAMPGLSVAVKNSEQPIKGLRDFAADAGAGFTDMSRNLVSGADASRTSMQTLGGAVRDLEGFTGQLVANLTNGAAKVLPQFAAGLHQVEDTVLTITSSGMPALQGATSGLLGTIGGGLGLVSAFAHALGSWAAPLGSAAGTLFGANSMLKLFGTSLSATGFGVNAFAKTVKDGESTISPFKAALNDAEKNGTSKLKAGASALVSNGINPLGLALTVGAFALDSFGEAQQKAAERAAEHRENVRQLTDAIRADNGVMGEHVDKVNIEALQTKNAANNLGVFGATLEVAKLAIQGNSGAMQVLTDKSNGVIETIGRQAGLTQQQVSGLKDVNQGLLTNGGTYQDVSGKIEALTSKTVAYGRSGGQAVSQLSQAQKDWLAATLNGTGAVGEQIKTERDARQAYVLSEMALNNLTATEVENRDATTKATEAIYAQQNAHLGLRGAQQNTKTALDEYNKVSNNSKAGADAKAASLLKVEQAFAAEEQAAYQAAFADNASKSSGEQLAAANAAANREVVKLAGSLGGTLPQSVQETISKFSVAQAKAAGLTIGIDNTGAAVYRLPNGKEIRISADTGQAVAALEQVRGVIRDTNGKVVTIRVNTEYGYTTTTFGQGPGAGRGHPAIAGGGLVERGRVQRFANGGQAYAYADGGSAMDVGPGGLLMGPGTGTSDGIIARVSNGEFVVRADQTKKHLPLLRAINNGSDGFAGGGMVQAEDGSWVSPDFYSRTSRGRNPQSWAEATRIKAAGGHLVQSTVDGHLIGTWVMPTAAASSGSPASSSSGFRSVPSVRLEFAAAGHSPLEMALIEIIRTYVRVAGAGNVQAAFGRS